MAKPSALLLAVLTAACVPMASKAQSCESLSKLSSPTISIALAKKIEGSGFSTTVDGETFARLPAFCRVVAKLAPTRDSDIGVEVWLPMNGWNSKFMAVGSGGWGGFINYDEMADALRRGYATSSTDDGHSSREEGAAFIMGHPEKFIDFAYRAQHGMTVQAKILIRSFYGRDARYSYWNGCSAGGREGLLQAYRYPDEFNGVIAGDPANIRRNAWALWLAVQSFKNPDDYIPPAKYPLLHRAVLDACDAKDGLKDGLIEDPERCHVDFTASQCKGSDSSNCLTPRQVHTAQTMISPAATPSGKVIFPRLEPGTELHWDRLAGGPDPADLFLDEYRFVVYQDPHWNWRTFDLERDSARAEAVDKNVDDLNPHLAGFASRGGKLLIYHGWADQQVAPGSSIEFYKSVVSLSGAPEQAATWVRLFMAPGMNHCGGGEGPDIFDKISTIEQWVEHGNAPARIIAAHETGGKVDRTRPLCPYPQFANYNGSGDMNDASSFACRPQQ